MAIEKTPETTQKEAAAAMTPTAHAAAPLPIAPSPAASLGTQVTDIPVIIGPRFLDLFSENLYRSPNKAFEELISNSWDADATVVHVVIPSDLSEPSATVWVLDNGRSMNLDGLRALWMVAESPKRRAVPPANSRYPIGKFGIGKLATYLLADEVTYVCRAADGTIRAVTMDYRRLGEVEAQHGLEMKSIPLSVRELDANALEQMLKGLASGDQVAALLEKKIPSDGYDFTDEFGGANPPAPAKTETWTLCILTSLKKPGRQMQVGQIKRMLRAALPLGKAMAIVFNGESLPSTKLDAAVEKTWVLGSANLPFDKIKLPDESEATVTSHATPEPHVAIDGLDGAVTGTVRLFANRISGGKSDEHGASNGFHVNVLGRVVNEDDAYFGLENLSHSAWAKFRAAVRADGLDRVIAVNRGTMREDHGLTVFRSFLLHLFNMARQADDAAKRETWKQAGEQLERSWGTVPVEPLHRLLSEHAESDRLEQLPAFVDAEGVVIDDLQKSLQDAPPADLIADVQLDPSSAPTDPLVRYDVSTRRVLVNENHPFSREHSATAEEQAVVRDAALATLLTDTYMADRGIDPTAIEEVLDFRDQVLRRIALVRRRSGAEIARILINAGTWRGLEIIVADALEYLGFSVQRIGGSNEPEGVVTAAVTATKQDKRQAYTFTYDTKHSASGKVQTGNVHSGGLRRHRENYAADHTLIVAPSFQSGALEQECKAQELTPMTAKDLGRLLLFAASNGPIDLKAFREVFALYDPAEVASWVDKFMEATKSKSSFSLPQFLEAIAAIGYDGNALSTAVIADRIRQKFGGKPTRAEVRQLAAGLSVLVPHLIQVGQADMVYLSTTPTKLRDAIVNQAAQIPSNYQFKLAELVKSDS